jgi:hypothetical protein
MDRALAQMRGILIIGSLRSRQRIFGPGSSGTGYKSAVGSCETVGSITCWKFLKQLLASQERLSSIGAS